MSKVICPGCGNERNVAKRTAEHIRRGARTKFCGSCGTIKGRYGIGFLHYLMVLREQGAVTWQEAKMLMQLADRDSNDMDDRLAIYRLLRRFGLEYETYQNHATPLKHQAQNARANFDCRSCEICGSANNLCKHHIWPVKFGGDPKGPLKCLCRECHKQAHVDIANRIRDKYGSVLEFRHKIFRKHLDELRVLFSR